MAVITKATWQPIVDAVTNPASFGRVGERKRLRAAVDSALEQITNHLLGNGARSREQMTQGLNRLLKKGKNALAKATLEVLKNYDSLESISYDEDDEEDDFADYVNDVLGPMIDLTTYG